MTTADIVDSYYGKPVVEFREGIRLRLKDIPLYTPVGYSGYAFSDTKRDRFMRGVVFTISEQDVSASCDLPEGVVRVQGNFYRFDWFELA
jgi:hypothetical protein